MFAVIIKAAPVPIGLSSIIINTLHDSEIFLHIYVSLKIAAPQCLTPIFVLGKTSAGRLTLLVSDWSEQDVSSWLVEEGLKGLVDKFRANNIDGTELLSLTKETLVSELHIGEEERHTLHSQHSLL